MFQDRFRSEPINTDSYLLTALRYIHQNPVRAGITLNCNEYPWSSYHDYINSGNSAEGITDIELGMDMSGSLKQFAEFHEDYNNNDMVDFEDDIKFR